MKKILLWMIVVSMVVVFSMVGSLVGCKPAAEEGTVVEEEVVAEEEEVVAEEEEVVAEEEEVVNGINLVGNGTFDKPLSNVQPDSDGVFNSEGSWIFYLNSGATGTAEISDGVLKISPDNIKTNPYGIQILQMPVPIEKAGKYEVSFDAKSTVPRSIIVKIGGSAFRQWFAYSGEKKVDINTEMKKYTVEFTMTMGTDLNGRVEFWFTAAKEPVWIDNISLIKVSQGIAKKEPVPGTKTESDEDKLENWELAWSDEFNGPKIDKNKWSFEIGNGSNGWGNNESEFYSDSPLNVFIENGCLIIKALKEDTIDGDEVYNYTSARMITKGKYNAPEYCKVEVMAKLPEGKGIWPAIWMLGNNIDEVSWPACGEIDIMELLGHEPWKVYGTAHGAVSAGPGIGGSFVLPEAVNGDKFSLGFHKFSVEIQPEAVEFFVDDVLYKIVNKSKTQYDAGDSEWVYDHPYFLILNVAVGGNWPGYPNDSTIFPQQMEVDYVRVYVNKGSFLNEGEAKWDPDYVLPLEPSFTEQKVE